MASPLFDDLLKQRRRDRAARQGPELFLARRMFDDILDRLGQIRRSFRSTLLLGCPDPEWRAELEALGHRVTVVDPGAEFARAAGGLCAVEDRTDFGLARFDLCVSVGLLDTVNDLPGLLARLRMALVHDGLLLAAFAGNESLPALRSAMRAYDRALGRPASPHVHPRIAAAAVAPLLQGAGFTMPVVDLERIQLSYGRFDDLVRDLRAMAATNILVERDRRGGTRAALAAARSAFAGGASDRTVETVELIFATAWSGAKHA